MVDDFSILLKQLQVSLHLFPGETFSEKEVLLQGKVVEIDILEKLAEFCKVYLIVSKLIIFLS